MAKILDKELMEAVLSNYFKKTSPLFDEDMGLRLKSAREKMKMTQKELADRLGLTQADVSRLEAGKMVYSGLTSDQFKSVLKEHFEYVLMNNGYYRYEDIKFKFNKQIRKMVGSK